MIIHAKSLIHSTIITAVFIVVSTILSELYEPLKTFLADVSGHHWVTKGIFSIIIFAILYFLLSKVYSDHLENIGKETFGVVLAVIIGGFSIFLFYIWHFLLG